MQNIPLKIPQNTLLINVSVLKLLNYKELLNQTQPNYIFSWENLFLGGFSPRGQFSGKFFLGGTFPRRFFPVPINVSLIYRYIMERTLNL